MEGFSGREIERHRTEYPCNHVVEGISTRDISRTAAAEADTQRKTIAAMTTFAVPVIYGRSADENPFR
jgi:hypothetical protein